MIIRFAVNNIARDVLTAAEGGEQIREIIADTFVGTQCLAYIEVLDEGVVIIVVLKVLDDPLIDCFDLIFVGFTAGTNFVSKFFRLRVPQGCATVVKVRGLRFADEIACKDHRDQNECRYC